MPIATSSGIIDISTEKLTKDIAEKISAKLKKNQIIFLYGEIGAGKTTFVKYVINKLQKDKKINITEVTSPTFNILNEYQLGDIKIKHYDLFRIKLKEEITNLNIFEDNSDSITLIEWPEIIDFKSDEYIELFFNYDEDLDRRSLEIKGLK
ncbi:MAG: tRNA (adenosine(37)-N6)-threonylcarbamoyltransferase complex ATPase subunit type 1 TsaE [Pelagibacteraceae bacterium]